MTFASMSAVARAASAAVTLALSFALHDAHEIVVDAAKRTAQAPNQ